jgi:mRNA degradation ribonuclease J1/J2
MFAPTQLLVVGFDGQHFTGAIAEELARLSDQGAIRVVDLLIVQKVAEDEVLIVETDISGDVAAALIGVHNDEPVEAGSNPLDPSDDEVWFVTDTIPVGTTAAVVLLEHLWAIPLRDAIKNAGGVPLAESWITDDDLLAAGATAA